MLWVLIVVFGIAVVAFAFWNAKQRDAAFRAGLAGIRDVDVIDDRRHGIGVKTKPPRTIVEVFRVDDSGVRGWYARSQAPKLGALTTLRLPLRSPVQGAPLDVDALAAGARGSDGDLVRATLEQSAVRDALVALSALGGLTVKLAANGELDLDFEQRTLEDPLEARRCAFAVANLVDALEECANIALPLGTTEGIKALGGTSGAPVGVSTNAPRV